MGSKSLYALTISGILFGATPALADHNSVWGEGWANMPNDIHNTRIEDDSETFLDLVQYGGGADSVNRYADDNATVLRGGSSMGSGGALTRGTSMGRLGRR